MIFNYDGKKLRKTDLTLTWLALKIEAQYIPNFFTILLCFSQSTCIWQSYQRAKNKKNWRKVTKKYQQKYLKTGPLASQVNADASNNGRCILKTHRCQMQAANIIIS